MLRRFALVLCFLGKSMGLRHTEISLEVLACVFAFCAVTSLGEGTPPEDLTTALAEITCIPESPHVFRYDEEDTARMIDNGAVPTAREARAWMTILHTASAKDLESWITSDDGKLQSVALYVAFSKVDANALKLAARLLDSKQRPLPETWENPQGGRVTLRAGRSMSHRATDAIRMRLGVEATSEAEFLARSGGQSADLFVRPYVERYRLAREFMGSGSSTKRADLIAAVNEARMEIASLPENLRWVVIARLRASADENMKASEAEALWETLSQEFRARLSSGEQPPILDHVLVDLDQRHPDDRVIANLREHARMLSRAKSPDTAR